MSKRFRPSEPPEPAPEAPPSKTGDPAQDLMAAMLAAVDDITTLVDRMEHSGAKAFAANATAEMHYAANMILLRRFRWALAWFGLAGAALLASGVLIGLWVAPGRDVRGLKCQDQDGGRVCAIWVIPPQQPTPGRH